jgi:hypothetical protein
MTPAAATGTLIRWHRPQSRGRMSRRSSLAIARPADPRLAAGGAPGGAIAVLPAGASVARPAAGSTVDGDAASIGRRRRLTYREYTRVRGPA